MYMLALYVTCVGLILLIGAILFAGFTVLIIIKEVCHWAAAIASRVLDRAAFAIFEQQSMGPLPRLASAHRSEWTGRVVGRPASPPHRHFR